MRDYLTSARDALDRFDDAVHGMLAVAGPSSTPPLLGRCRETGAGLLAATTALRLSLALPEQSAVDMSDLQFRLEDESRRVAHHLKALGQAVAAATGAARGAAEAVTPALQLLEERAQRVAAALFPSAIDGVREINKALWDARLIWKDYGAVFERAVTGKLSGLSSAQITAVDATARDVLARFDAVNALLNHLVTAPLVGERATATGLIDEARKELTAAVRRARSRAADVYKPFHPVLARAERLASRVDQLFQGLRVPVFPAPDRLEPLAGCVPADLYRRLAGVERFALLNIGSRMQSIPIAPGSTESLVAPRFGIRVFDVFADRVYFTAQRDLLHAVQALEGHGVFSAAPAGLHRFRDGSFKQTQGRKGNLQISYAAGTPEDPSDATRISVDADIDLYRGTVSHLFGEVLVNHLTGSKTDQFKVYDILAASSVPMIGGFDVVSV